ncbi:DUF4148 domain-containing protein [Burkholderia gladioli]|uniref:DUF4148 domain-containing protein n=1 Tax=Burkholderia gladioli TaxID=28095 RepID=UPI001641BC20|nr:DUF4148 domain-containing protein [Burkholderia gladioli]
MKTIIVSALVATLFAAPALSFAQQAGQPLTRAQVRADLVALERAGYRPAQGEDIHYPADFEAAEARLTQQRPAALARSNAGQLSATH